MVTPETDEIAYSGNVQSCAVEGYTKVCCLSENNDA